MKTLIFAMMLFLGSTVVSASAPPDVNEKVLNAFHKTFKDPKEVNWHEYDDFYEVSFKQDEIKTRVRYDNDGNVLVTLRYYFESQLPPYIRSSIMMKYPKRSIYGVTEIFSENTLYYYVTMEDAKHWYTVRSNSSGELEQTEKFNKAPTN